MRKTLFTATLAGALFALPAAAEESWHFQTVTGGILTFGAEPDNEETHLLTIGCTPTEGALSIFVHETADRLAAEPPIVTLTLTVTDAAGSALAIFETEAVVEPNELAGTSSVFAEPPFDDVAFFEALPTGAALNVLVTQNTDAGTVATETTLPLVAGEEARTAFSRLCTDGG